MKAQETNLLKFLQGTKQFVIPIYQRTYSWSLEQCQQLWDDIVRVTEHEEIPAHFLGSIIYIERGLYQVSAVPELLVIDGQQRLTTLSIFLAALGEAIDQEESPAITQKKISNYYLVNGEEEGEVRHKLLLTKSDRETLIRLIEGADPPGDAAKQLVRNYEYFKDQLAKAEHSASDIYRAISKLIVVDISLDANHDNPQLIFESLNSTGLDLSQADLVRNFVLMGVDRGLQTELYEHHWYPMEQSFGHAEYSELFDRFMRDYLTLKGDTLDIPKINEVYEEFKKYAQKQQVTGGTTKALVADVHRFSRHFVKLAFLRDDDPEVNGALSDINALKVDVAYPFLLQVYDDYAEGNVTKAELLDVLRLVESYVFRRSICGIPTNSLNKTFAGLPRLIDRENYVGSIKAQFLLKDSYRRFPRDEEFQRQFVVKDVYSLRTRNYILRKLENDGRKELVNVEEYTIEHILPQNENLSEAWQDMLGENWREIQEKYLHTIGNLTLTGYNPELSDRPFGEKLKMDGGFADSPIRLNRFVAEQVSWNEGSIQNRADLLVKQALQLWPLPNVPSEQIEGYREKPKTKERESYTFKDHEYLDGKTLELFELLRKRILNLDASVREEIRKYYIAYKSSTNFVDIIPQRSGLIMSLNIAMEELNDPQDWARDVTSIGRWGTGKVEAKLTKADDLPYAVDLVTQALDVQREATEV